MKRIQTTIIYNVPHWNFCNVDRFDMDATPSKQVCQFCVKTKEGYRCMLHNQPLMFDGVQVRKTDKCCDATAGFASTVVADPAPQSAASPSIQPRDLIKQTIEMYNKTVSELVSKGYPRAMAELAAKKHMLSSE